MNYRVTLIFTIFDSCVNACHTFAIFTSLVIPFSIYILRVALRNVSLRRL